MRKMKTRIGQLFIIKRMMGQFAPYIIRCQ